MLIKTAKGILVFILRYLKATLIILFPVIRIQLLIQVSIVFLKPVDIQGTSGQLGKCWHIISVAHVSVILCEDTFFK